MNSRWRVNFLHVCLGIALIIIMTKASSFLEPYGWYFTFSGTLFGVPQAGVLPTGTPQTGVSQPEVPQSGLLERGVPQLGVAQKISWPAILIRYGIPAIVGFIIGFLAQENPIGTAGAMGFSAAFILAWPAFNDWAKYADPRLLNPAYNLENAFKIIYLLNCVAYYFLATFGASLAIKYLNYREQQGETRADMLRSVLDKLTVGRLVGAAIAATASFVFEKLILAQIFNVS